MISVYRSCKTREKRSVSFEPRAGRVSPRQGITATKGLPLCEFAGACLVSLGSRIEKGKVTRVERGARSPASGRGLGPTTLYNESLQLCLRTPLLAHLSSEHCTCCTSFNFPLQTWLCTYSSPNQVLSCEMRARCTRRAQVRATKHAGGVQTNLKLATVFNIVGPNCSHEPV